MDGTDSDPTDGSKREHWNADAEEAPGTSRRSFLGALGAAVAGVATGSLADRSEARQSVTDGRFNGDFYQQAMQVAYVGPGSKPYSTGVQAGNDPYQDPDAIPMPPGNWQPIYQNQQPPQWGIVVPTDWELPTYVAQLGDVSSMISGRNRQLWLERAMGAGILTTTPGVIIGATSGFGIDATVVVDQYHGISVEQAANNVHNNNVQVDPIYPQYPTFWSYYTQTNGEPGAFYAYWTLPPEAYWFASIRDNVYPTNPDWNNQPALSIGAIVSHGQVLYDVHTHIHLNFDPTTHVPLIAKGWRSVTEHVMYQMVTSFTTYSYA